MAFTPPYYPKDFIAREASKIFLQTGAVLVNADEPFTYTSGRKGPVYVDCRKLISLPHARGILMDMAVSLLSQEVGLDGIDVVAGGETAGIPYAAFMSERMNVPMAYIRKKPKGHGRTAQIEGEVPEGSNVVLIEDLQNYGTSKKIFIEALRNANTNIEHVFVLFNYGVFEAVEAESKELGVTVHSLTTWPLLLETAQRMKYFDQKTADTVLEFLNDPVGWSVAHGGAGE